MTAVPEILTMTGGRAIVSTGQGTAGHVWERTCDPLAGARTVVRARFGPAGREIPAEGWQPPGGFPRSRPAGACITAHG